VCQFCKQEKGIWKHIIECDKKPASLITKEILINRWLEKHGLDTNKDKIFTDIGLKELKRGIGGNIEKEKQTIGEILELVELYLR